MPSRTAGGHLTPEDFFDFIEKRSRRRELERARAHLDVCDDCVETLSRIIDAERLPSREEEELLARSPAPSPEQVLSKLRAHIVASSPAALERSGLEWKPLLAAAIGAVVLISTGWLVRDRYWLPELSRRAAEETLHALVELRQATGRIPLRYIEGFERASVTRSGFDSADPAEEALIASLEAAVARSPERQAVLTLGLILLDDGKLDESESYLRRALEEDRASVDALNGLAVIHYERAIRQPEAAYALRQQGLALLRQAQAAGPEDLRVLYNFGKFYEALEMREAAAKAWLRYLQMDPASQWADEARYQLAQLQ